MKNDEISQKKKRNLGTEVAVGRMSSLCRKDHAPKRHKYDDLNADI